MQLLEQQQFNVDLQEKQKRVSSTIDTFNKFTKEARNINKEFFFQIVILCTAVIGLSVTFIGYLANKGNISFILILFISWFSLTIALISSLLRNFIYSTFGHWQVNASRVEALLERERGFLELATKYPTQISNLTTQEEIDEYIKTVKTNIKKYKSGLEFNKVREKKYQFKWKLTEIAAIYGVIVGVVTLLLFVGLNIPNLIRGGNNIAESRIIFEEVRETISSNYQ